MLALARSYHPGIIKLYLQFEDKKKKNNKKNLSLSGKKLRKRPWKELERLWDMQPEQKHVQSVQNLFSLLNMQILDVLAAFGAANAPWTERGNIHFFIKGEGNKDWVESWSHVLWQTWLPITFFLAFSRWL